jgi:5'-3' exonuclease
MASPQFEVHLVDGTYELFRHHFAVPSHLDDDGIEVAATRGVVGSILAMLEQGATHVGVATDHVVESFRNDLWLGYKTSAGMDPELLAQFPMLEDALRALGVTVWAMVDLEADDGLASAARVARDDPRVERVFICTPDKDLGQCVEDPKVMQLDRRQNRKLDEAAVRERFGVGPRSIPDYLALVGDSADGFPGLPGWGAKSAAAVLARYEHLDAIPTDARDWDVDVRGAAKLAATFAGAREAADLFLDLATLRVDADVGTVDDWEWRGAAPELGAWAKRLGADNLVARADRLATKRFG